MNITYDFSKKSGFSYFRFLLLFIFLNLWSVACVADAVGTDEHKKFNVVAYHVDLRVQVMPINTLKLMAKEIAAHGFNTLIMEWEATYPYEQHRLIPNRYAYSREEIAEFVKYSESLGLDVIPLQQTLGHLEYLLRYERYAYLRADKKDLSQIDPTRLKEAKELFTELFSDILSAHKSKYVHIGGDETRILNCKRCQEAWGKDREKIGKSKLYVEYMKMIAEIVTAQGKTPIMWADMILAYPDAVAQMPKNVIYIDWNYGWAFNHFGEDPSTLIKKYGLTFWGASAIRSWPDDYYVTNWAAHMNNQADYVTYAKKAGFDGMVLTSWSTSGEYTYEWIAHAEVVDIFPMRQVYPHAYPNDGFRMNTSAFIEAIGQSNKLVPDSFAQQYAQKRFGLTADESQSLWNILKSASLGLKADIGSVPLSGVPGLPSVKRKASQYLTEVVQLKSKLASIRPKQNAQEFSHFVMQVDIREFYLRFRVIQDLVESTNFSEADHISVVKQLAALLKDSHKLDKRFERLFTGKLYKSEIENLNKIRSKQVVILYEQLTRAK